VSTTDRVHHGEAAKSLMRSEAAWASVAQLPQCDGRAGRDAAGQDQRLGDSRGRHC